MRAMHIVRRAKRREYSLPLATYSKGLLDALLSKQRSTRKARHHLHDGLEQLRMTEREFDEFTDLP